MSVTITEFLKRPRIYDGKRLWEEYHSWGRAATHDKLREWALANGMVNTRSGKVSQMGPFFAMWRYALHNPEEAYPAYERWAKEYEEYLVPEGMDIDFKAFLKDIREHAKHGGVVGRQTYLEFCEKYELEP